ncbi:MAG TPA: hypothetical protein VGX51_10585 [Solirubrobacteraceae bacterium]|nr:hypothetical protein [Solirubrobacteraceae bacterium]
MDASGRNARCPWSGHHLPDIFTYPSLRDGNQLTHLLHRRLSCGQRA